MTDPTITIPARVRLSLLAAAPAEMRLHWARHLTSIEPCMAEGFIEALNSPGIEVHADQAESDPAEILVRGSGTTAAGVGWRDLNIILLDPWWSDNAKSSQLLADTIVAKWRDLQALSRQTPRAPVSIVTDVRPHGDNLSIVKVEGNEVVANRRDDGSFRWQVGEIVVYVPEGMIVPDDVLQDRGYWHDGKGMLAGKRRNRVKMRCFAGHESRGLLFKVVEHGGIPAIVRGDAVIAAQIGDDAADFLGLVDHQG